MGRPTQGRGPGRDGRGREAERVGAVREGFLGGKDK